MARGNKGEEYNVIYWLRYLYMVIPHILYTWYQTTGVSTLPSVSFTPHPQPLPPTPLHLVSLDGCCLLNIVCSSQDMSDPFRQQVVRVISKGHTSLKLPFAEALLKKNRFFFLCTTDKICFSFYFSPTHATAGFPGRISPLVLLGGTSSRKQVSAISRPSVGHPDM